MEGALIDLSEGRYPTTAAAAAAPTGPDGAAGPDRPLTITRGREIAARLSELSVAFEVGVFLRSVRGGGAAAAAGGCALLSLSRLAPEPAQ